MLQTSNTVVEQVIIWNTRRGIVLLEQSNQEIFQIIRLKAYYLAQIMRRMGEGLFPPHLTIYINF